MERAPLHEDVARAPRGGEAWWLTSGGGTRIRAAAWPAAEGVPAKGTVLLFPGRTEYIEKYGPATEEFTARGYGVITVDWRGQGLSDRGAPDRRLGHVEDFSEFQDDVAALVNLAQWLELPEPWFMVGHSMGGCIGLRALHNGAPVKAAAFSAPMWGMQMPLHMRPVAWASSFIGNLLGQGLNLTPGTEIECYAATAPFEDNTLTSDAQMFGFIQGQLSAYPDLALGGPSLSWLKAALVETLQLSFMTPPKIPAVTFLGSNERIVAPGPIHKIMEKWTAGTLEIIDGAEHEVLMERVETRTRFFDTSSELFERHG